MKYTKWRAYKNALGTWSISTNVEPIAQVERHYNALLIAAAPELYEATKLAKSFIASLIKAYPDEREGLVNNSSRLTTLENILKEAISKVEEK